MKSECMKEAINMMCRSKYYSRRDIGVQDVSLLLFFRRAALFSSLFFFQHKTAFVLRISYWSSDFCSSSLRGEGADGPLDHEAPHHARSGLLRGGGGQD